MPAQKTLPPPPLPDAWRCHGARSAQECRRGEAYPYPMAAVTRDTSRQERAALKLTLAATVLLGVSGLFVALATGSQSVLFDAIFTLLYLLVTLVSFKVTTLVARGPDRQYPFGYYVFEPILNFGKAAMTCLVSLYALVVSLMALSQGGREVETGIVAIFVGCSAIISLLIAWRIRRTARDVVSPLLAVEGMDWAVDGFISLAVAVAFLGATFLRTTPFAWMIPYVDPAIVIVLVVLILPYPIRTARRAARQFLMQGVEPEVKRQITRAIRSVLGRPAHLIWDVHAIEVGRVLFIYLLVASPAEGPYGTLVAQDEQREAIVEALTERLAPRPLDIDVVFTLLSAEEEDEDT